MVTGCSQRALASFKSESVPRLPIQARPTPKPRAREARTGLRDTARPYKVPVSYHPKAVSSRGPPRVGPRAAPVPEWWTGHKIYISVLIGHIVYFDDRGTKYVCQSVRLLGRIKTHYAPWSPTRPCRQSIRPEPNYPSVCCYAGHRRAEAQPQGLAWVI